MHPLGRHAGGDRIQQIAAMQRHMRRAVKLFASWIERRLLQSLPIIPAALMASERAHADAIKRRTQAETKQNATSVRPHVDAATDLGQFRGLFVNLHLESGLAQRHRGAEAADPGADDGDARHDPWAFRQRVARPDRSGRVTTCRLSAACLP